MRRITLWVTSTVAALVLLFSYRTSLGGSTATAAAAATAGGTSSSSGSTTYKGSVAQTRWGAVRISITVTNGKITSVTVPTYPNSNGRDQEINAYALPVLKQETLTAQSATIDTVSGATVTSDGYIQSLQSAIDAARLS